MGRFCEVVQCYDVFNMKISKIKETSFKKNDLYTNK